MYINKEYLASLKNLINQTPWRVNDGDLDYLLSFTETLVREYEELKKEHSKIISDKIIDTEMLKGQLIVSMLPAPKD